VTTLDEILATTRAGLPALRAHRRAWERQAADRAAPPSFAAALRGPTLGLVAEVKRRSPSAGAINEAIDAPARAAAYAAAGASAISVLTDGPFFGGSVDDLRAVADRVAVPALRKDFILHEDQLLEARAAGAAAALLIVRALPPARLRELLRFAAALGLDALVEVHDRRELDAALDAEATIIGVNSRDLTTFRIDVAAAWALLGQVPAARLAVAESGMETSADTARAARAGADAVLVGTALSRPADPAALVAAIVAEPRHAR